jgi:carbon dioxide concentrating mechanism protein CcmN
MSVSPLYPISNSNSYISGEVTIDPTAVIAAGVLLQAAPNSKIIIAAGACIGMGTVLHAHDGILEIEAGAILGAGVLVVGKGKIGANACIGSASTIMDCSIKPGQVVAPGSLLGDTSRQVADAQPTANHITTSSPASLKQAAESSISQPDESESEQSQLQSELTTSNNGTQVVYGKASLTQLISTLFPQSRSLNQPLPDGSSQSEST